MGKYKKMLEESDALVNGHFRLASNRHGNVYVNKTVAFAYASVRDAFAMRIARHFNHLHIEAVIAPELGAVLLGGAVAHRLFRLRGRDVACVIAEKVRATLGIPDFVIARGQQSFLRGRRAVVVEDILTTGMSARQIVSAARAAGAQVLGVGAMLNRGGVSAAGLKVPELFSVIDEPFISYAPSECPQCKAGIPLDNPKK